MLVSPGSVGYFSNDRLMTLKKLCSTWIRLSSSQRNYSQIGKKVSLLSKLWNDLTSACGATFHFADRSPSSTCTVQVFENKETHWNNCSSSSQIGYLLHWLQFWQHHWQHRVCQDDFGQADGLFQLINQVGKDDPEMNAVIATVR